MGFSYITAPNISAKHAFSMRFGNPSDGKFSQENLDALCQALSISTSSVVSSNQVHGARVRVVQKPESIAEDADAMITNAVGIALMVFTADCTPILLHDPAQGAIGAVHAGWRGTTLNIAAAAVDKMKYEFGCSPADIRAAIGPCISECCYETDGDVAEAFRKALGGDLAVDCVKQRANKFMIDLKEANRLMLTQAGVLDIFVSNDCTACSSDKYWSHRVHGRNRGAQAAIICNIM